MKKLQPQDLNRMMDLWQPKMMRVGAPWQPGAPWSPTEDGDMDVMERYIKNTFPRPEGRLIYQETVEEFFAANPQLLVEFLYGPAVMHKLEVLPEHKSMFNAAFTLAECGYTAADMPMAEEITKLLATEYLPQLIDALDWADGEVNKFEIELLEHTIEENIWAEACKEDEDKE